MTGRPPHLSVVVPAFNEAERIGETVAALRRWLLSCPFEWEVRVVDDGSEDETRQIVEHSAAEDSRIVIQREPHRGKGATVRAGMLAAQGELRFMCDADLSMPLHELTRFLAVAPSECDIAFGSRQAETAVRVAEPAYRHLMGRAFNALVQGTLLPGISDSQCGFKLFTAGAAQAVFSRVTIEGWAFDVEVLFVARTQGWRLAEVPIEWHHRPDSRVSPLRDPFRMLRDVLRIRSNARQGLYGTRSQ